MIYSHSNLQNSLKHTRQEHAADCLCDDLDNQMPAEVWEMKIA